MPLRIAGRIRRQSDGELDGEELDLVMLVVFFATREYFVAAKLPQYIDIEARLLFGLRGAHRSFSDPYLTPGIIPAWSSAYSHSIVPGGLLDTSYTTRFTRRRLITDVVPEHLPHSFDPGQLRRELPPA